MRAKVAKRAPDKRPDGRDSQGRAGSSLLGHLIAVKTGDDRGRLSGDIHQDGGNGSAIHGAVVNGRKHDNGAKWGPD